MARQDTVSRTQERSWGYYGFSGSSNRPVGEVRYVVGWLADQMTRLEWDVLIDGSEEWTVDIEGDEATERISTTDAEGDEDVTAASMKLLELVGWTETNVRAITTNLFVGGQGNYIRQGDDWRVVSVVEAKRKETLAEAAENIPFIWPHPADPKKPDAPLFSVLDLLDELEWLNRQARTQSRQRVLFSGVTLTAEGFGGADGGKWWETYNEALSARTRDPDDLSPINLSGPLDLIKEGFRWEIPSFGYDDVIDRRIRGAIERLAYGLPIPKEILLGMQAASRATAFQIEESGYRAHIEPPASLVAQVGSDAVTLILEDGRTAQVVPNPSQMLARKQSVEDVKWAREQGLADPTYTREVLGIPEDAAPEEDDGVPISSAPIGRDPANVADQEPVAAAASSPNLSDLLAQIDQSLSYELAGFTVAVTDRARQRLGAIARSNELIRTDPTFKGLKSGELAHKLGADGLAAAGVDVQAQIAEPIDAATRWWVARIGQAWGQAATLVPGWTGQGDWVEESVSKLADSLQTHIIDTLGLTDPGPLDAGAIRDVLDAAAGGSTYGVR